MTEHCYCGIDVAKERLDVQVLPHRQRFSVDNNATGWAELVERLHALPIAAVGIEPSGGYERGIIRILLAAGLSVRRINPSKLRQFARARGILAKNDRIKRTCQSRSAMSAFGGKGTLMHRFGFT